PDLSARRLARSVARNRTRGEKRDRSAIGTPTRAAGRLRRSGERQPFARAISGHRPDVAVPPILFPIDRRHHIRDRRSVGREMWIRERFERQIVVGGDAANLRESRRRRRGEHECQNSQLFHARALFSGVIREIFRSPTSIVAGFFFVELIESRLFLSASIRLTTFGGASTSGVTISRPSIFASMISRRPTW